MSASDPSVFSHDMHHSPMDAPITWMFHSHTYVDTDQAWSLMADIVLAYMYSITVAELRYLSVNILTTNIAIYSFKRKYNTWYAKTMLLY